MERRTRIRKGKGRRSPGDGQAIRHARGERRERGHSVSRRAGLAAGRRATRQPTIRQVVTTLRLGADIHRRLQLLAADEGRSANAIIEKLLRRHLDAQGVPPRLRRRR